MRTYKEYLIPETIDHEALDCITKVERTSKFKISNGFRNSGKDILIKVNLLCE